MVSPALTLTYIEKRQRQLFKRRTLMEFLASGEVYTTLAVTAMLIQSSERTALRLLHTLAKEKFIKIDKDAGHNHQNLYGVSAHGLAMTEAIHPKCREYASGKTNPDYIQHHVGCQIIRIKAEQSGWRNWQPEKILYAENSARLKKIPDAVATRPDGRLAAIENERNTKSFKRHADVVGAHLTQIVAGKYDLVYYFSPNPPGLQRVFDKVKFVNINGSKVKLNDNHRSRFKIFEINAWKGEI